MLPEKDKSPLLLWIIFSLAVFPMVLSLTIARWLGDLWPSLQSLATLIALLVTFAGFGFAMWVAQWYTHRDGP